MGRLIYSGIASADGYLADADGGFDWAMPSEEAVQFLVELEDGVGTYLYGRRMYELMAVWDTPERLPEPTAGDLAFAAMWQRADKVVYSTTLVGVTTARTTLRSRFDADEVRRLKDELPGDITVAGPTLAAAAITAGLVDEWQLFTAPAVVGGGLRLLPPGVRIDLTLADQRAFPGGMTYARYLTA